MSSSTQSSAPAGLFLGIPIPARAHLYLSAHGLSVEDARRIEHAAVAQGLKTCVSTFSEVDALEIRGDGAELSVFVNPAGSLGSVRETAPAVEVGEPEAQPLAESVEVARVRAAGALVDKVLGAPEDSTGRTDSPIEVGDRVVLRSPESRYDGTHATVDALDGQDVYVVFGDGSFAEHDCWDLKRVQRVDAQETAA